MAVSKKDAKAGAENIKHLLELYQRNPEATVWVDKGYYHLESFIVAYKDIQLRNSLGAETKADKLLLSIMAFSVMG